MNFAREAVRFWVLAGEQERRAHQAGEELKERHGTVVPHPVRDEALGLQRHYLRKAHAAAAIAQALGHTLGAQDRNYVHDL